MKRFLVGLMLLFPLTVHANPLAADVVAVSGKYLHVKEKTGHNDHPMIDYWLAGVGLDNKAQLKRTGTGYSWCAAFVHGMYQEAAVAQKVKNPLPRYAGVLNLWEYSKANELRFKIIDPEDIISGLERGEPGDIFIMLHGHGLGHTGLTVKQKDQSCELTREGNTNAAGSREGSGVQNKVRPVSSLKGLIRPK